MKLNILLLLCVVIVSLNAVLAQQAGEFDVFFGSDGIVVTDLGGTNESGRSIAVQSDGKIVVGGDSNEYLALVRYNADGTLDEAFGINGIVIPAFDTWNADGNSVAILSDGRIVLAGSLKNVTTEDYDFAITCYNPDGSVDSSFGTNGIKLTDISGGGDYIYGIAVQPDGKIVAAGNADIHIGLARYKPNGTFDQGFGNNGKVFTDIIWGNESVFDVALQTDGKIVVGGHVDSAGMGENFVILRYNENGTLDSSFGYDGHIITVLSNNSRVNAIEIQPDGKIIAGGYSSSDFALARYNANGTLDAGFGNGGKVTTEFNGSDNIESIALQSDGKIIAAGLSWDGFPNTITSLALARYKPDGSLDSTFGNNGKVMKSYIYTTEYNTEGVHLEDVCLQEDGQILTSGRAKIDNDFDFFIARWLSEFTCNSVYYLDDDGDGYGDPDTSIIDCSSPSGYVQNQKDCDDTDPLVYNGADEICNNKDDDCDDKVDADDPSLTDGQLYYEDNDGDGYGSNSDIMACIQPPNTSLNSDDCKDTDPAIHPAADEICDNQDNNCNGLNDANDPFLIDGQIYFKDIDGDGYGSTISVIACSPPPNSSLNDDDCKDNDPEIHPGADEICDNVDNNCNALYDSDDPLILDAQLFYLDADNDDFGSSTDSLLTCSPPSGYVLNKLDCDDGNTNANPGAEEIPGNGIDEDCDGLLDEICSADFTLVDDSLITHHYWLISAANGIPPINYLWQWGDGSSDTVAYPSHTYDTAGFYNICLFIVDSSGCSDSSCVGYDLEKSEQMNTIISVDVVDSIPDIATLMQNNNLLQSWSVYPNPATEHVVVNYSISSSAMVTIELNDVLGNSVFQNSIERDRGEHKTVIDLRLFSGAIYYLKIQAANEIITKKLILIQ